MAMPKEPVSFDVLGASVRLGPNAVKEVGSYFRKIGPRKVFVATDDGVVKAGLLKSPLAALENASIPYEVFKDIEPNPSDRTIMAGAEAFKKTGCSAVLGLGGGSALDAAKAIQVMACHPGHVSEYFGVAAASKINHGVKPYLIAVPTTSGTGSEVSRGSIITNTATNTKCVMRAGIPSLAVIDPEMTVSMPPFLTAATGMDALSHNIEAAVSHVYHPVCMSLALEGIRLVRKSLRKAVEAGSDLEARLDMAAASMMGALAFQKGLGTVHSLAHQLSTDANVHHGVANSILLPHVIRFNSGHASAAILEIARAWGQDVNSLSPAAAGERVCAAITRLSVEIGLPQRLRDVGVKEDQITPMAQKAMGDWCHPFNPRPCTQADMEYLYRQAY
ncbi:MAG TPA: iron-containing alcohol dehydrogenase [Thermodesulfobacteriota bacterium]|nr:iron-containing alcohol dehydrogenase [Thermodesulfobacteriota bacterium]